MPCYRRRQYAAEPYGAVFINKAYKGERSQSGVVSFRGVSPAGRRGMLPR